MAGPSLQVSAASRCWRGAILLAAAVQVLLMQVQAAAVAGLIQLQATQLPGHDTAMYQEFTLW
jgi:hypothetical protein